MGEISMSAASNNLHGFQQAAEPFSTRSYLDNVNMSVSQENNDAFKSASNSTHMQAKAMAKPVIENQMN